MWLHFTMYQGLCSKACTIHNIGYFRNLRFRFGHKNHIKIGAQALQICAVEKQKVLWVCHFIFPLLIGGKEISIVVSTRGEKCCDHQWQNFYLKIAFIFTCNNSTIHIYSRLIAIFSNWVIDCRSWKYIFSTTGFYCGLWLLVSL